MNGLKAQQWSCLSGTLARRKPVKHAGYEPVSLLVWSLLVSKVEPSVLVWFILLPVMIWLGLVDVV